MPVSADQSPLVGVPVFPEGAVQVAMLSDAAERAAEQERLALAQTLHDTLCQSLTGIRLLATLAERKARKHAELAGDLGELRAMIGKVSDEVHKFVNDLRSPPPGRSLSIK